MRRDVSDVDGIYPFHMTEAISVGPLISRTQRKHGHAQMSQYEILSLFVLSVSTWRSRNIKIDKRMTWSMPH